MSCRHQSYTADLGQYDEPDLSGVPGRAKEYGAGIARIVDCRAALVEEGLVAVDTPVHHVLPEFKGVGVYNGGGAGVPSPPPPAITKTRSTSGSMPSAARASALLVMAG